MFEAMTPFETVYIGTALVMLLLSIGLGAVTMCVLKRLERQFTRK